MNTPKPIHGAPKPKDVPSDMTDTPPVPFPFAVGDVVRYTNDYGLISKARIRGFAKEPQNGRFVYLEHWSGSNWRLSAWWYADNPNSCSAL